MTARFKGWRRPTADQEFLNIFLHVLFLVPLSSSPLLFRFLLSFGLQAWNHVISEQRRQRVYITINY